MRTPLTPTHPLRVPVDALGTLEYATAILWGAKLSVREQAIRPALADVRIGLAELMEAAQEHLPPRSQAKRDTDAQARLRAALVKLGVAL